MKDTLEEIIGRDDQAGGTAPSVHPEIDPIPTVQQPVRNIPDRRFSDSGLGEFPW